jgi:uroporphyrinogen-III synthase
LKTIFISKNISELDELGDFTAKLDFQFDCQSLIRFSPTKFELPLDFDVVFISSIRSVQFLEESSQIDLASYTIACVGHQTSYRIQKMGYKTSFVGSNAGNPLAVSKEFSYWLGTRTVFIPHSNLSLRSIETSIPKRQLRSVAIYETILNGVKIDPKDIYVFTSPSNVDAFHMHNKLPLKAIIIAWGNSTRAALEKYATESHFVLEQGTLEELILILNSLIKS